MIKTRVEYFAVQKRAIETRDKILRSATELFARSGMNGTTVDQIAANAGVNKQRIYAYFGSKEKLFATALAHVFKEAEPFAETMISEAEAHPEKLTSCLLGGFKKFHENNPLFWRLLAWANLEDARLLDGLKDARKTENAAIRRVFDRAGELGMLKNISFEQYLFTMLAVPWFLRSNALTLRYTLGYDPLDEAFVSGLFDSLNALLQDTAK